MKNSGKKILVVDDNEDIGVVIKVMLQIQGFEVITRLDAIELSAYISELQPDLLIMDMLLSGADGREVCKELKLLPALKKMPVVMISAHPTARKECTEAGADYFLEKPFEMEELFTTVKQALAKFD